jgi:GPN-loop GTPase
MVRLELPHVNVLTKMDLVAPEDRRSVDELLIPDGKRLAEQLSAAATGPKYRRLNAAVAGLLDEFSLVSFLPLDSTDEESLAVVLGNLDMALQYGEDAEVRVRDDEEVPGGGRDGGDGDGGDGGGGDGDFGGGGMDELARAMQQAIVGGGDGGGDGLGGTGRD